MCEYEQFVYTCGHTPIRRSSYCHSARCDDAHQCFSVKVLKKVWRQASICPECQNQMEARGGLQHQLYANRG
jgi:hypothetical protein